MDAEDYLNDEEKFNVTDRFLPLKFQIFWFFFLKKNANFDFKNANFDFKNANFDWVIALY